MISQKRSFVRKQSKRGTDSSVLESQISDSKLEKSGSCVDLSTPISLRLVRLNSSSSFMPTLTGVKDRKLKEVFRPAIRDLKSCINVFKGLSANSPSSAETWERHSPKCLCHLRSK
jgi:hypothetical protein